MRKALSTLQGEFLQFLSDRSDFFSSIFHLHPTITIVERCEPSLAGGEATRNIHKEKCKSQQENCRKEGGDFPQEPHSFP